MGIRHLKGENLIQITAPISPGSSGGPVVNKKGEVIGIAVAFLSGGQNLNFAVPASYLAPLITDIKPPVSLASLIGRSSSTEGPSEPGVVESCGGPVNPRITLLGLDPKGYCYFADSLLKQGRYAEARDAAQASVRLKPSGWGYALLGYAYYELRCGPNSLESYQQCIRVEPRYDAGYSGVGFAYKLMGRYDDAAQAFKESIRVKPKDGPAHFELGLCYYYLDRENQAIEEFRACIKLNHRKSASYQMIGVCLVDLGESALRTGPADGFFNQARASYEEAIRIENQNYGAHYGLGYLYVLMKDKQRAMEQYQILVVLDREGAERLLETIHNYLQ